MVGYFNHPDIRFRLTALAIMKRIGYCGFKLEDESGLSGGTLNALSIAAALNTNPHFQTVFRKGMEMMFPSVYAGGGKNSTEIIQSFAQECEAIEMRGEDTTICNEIEEAYNSAVGYKRCTDSACVGLPSPLPLRISFSPPSTLLSPSASFPSPPPAAPLTTRGRIFLPEKFGDLAGCRPSLVLGTAAGPRASPSSSSRALCSAFWPSLPSSTPTGPSRCDFGRDGAAIAPIFFELALANNGFSAKVVLMAAGCRAATSPPMFLVIMPCACGLHSRELANR